jgi:dihydrofolate reductase
MQLNLIVATDKNGVIGNSKTNEIPWHLPPDLKNFKKITSGYPVIMGKNTWLSLGDKKPLPNRKNIIITTRPSDLELGYNEFEHLEKDIFAFTDLTTAIIFCENWLKVDKCFIIGGGKIYENALHQFEIHKVYKTLVDLESDGDIIFNFPIKNYTLISEEKNNYKDINYSFLEYELNT